MFQQRYAIRDVRQFLLVGIGLFVAYLAGSLVASGNETRLALLAVASVGGLVLYNPRLGLYAFCFTLLLVPIDWRIEGLKGTSVNAILIGLSTVALGTSMLVRRNRLTFSSLYVPAGIAVLVAWLNFLLRYGTPFWNVPLILSEALIVFVLSFHLISNQAHLRRLLISVLLAITMITMIDVVWTLISIQGGSSLGAIRGEQTWIGTASTTQSHFRGMLLPLLIASTLLAPDRRIRFLALVALLTTVAWLALAHTRTGFLVLALAPVATLILLPGAQRARFLPLLLLAVPIVFVSATYLTDAWNILMEKNRAELEVGFEAPRAALWLDAYRGFVANPWIGSGLGPSHSYFLGTGRKMGLVFLVPLAVTLWLIWRHGAWLRRQPLDPLSRTFVIGVQAAVMIAIVQNFVGPMFQGAVNAFYFWLLVGVQEAIYLDVHSGRFTIVKRPTSIAARQS